MIIIFRLSRNIIPIVYFRDKDICSLSIISATSYNFCFHDSECWWQRIYAHTPSKIWGNIHWVNYLTQQLILFLIYVCLHDSECWWFFAYIIQSTAGEAFLLVSYEKTYGSHYLVYLYLSISLSLSILVQLMTNIITYFVCYKDRQYDIAATKHYHHRF